MIRQLIIFLSLFYIVGCASISHNSIEDANYSFSISVIKDQRLPDKLTFTLNQQLADLFNSSEDPRAAKYSLSVSYQTTKQALQTQQDATYSRVRAGLILNYKLSDLGGKIINSGKVEAYDSFSLSTSTYSDFISEHETYNRLAELATNKLKIRVYQDLYKFEKSANQG